MDIGYIRDEPKINAFRPNGLESLRLGENIQACKASVVDGPTERASACIRGPENDLPTAFK